MTSTFLCLAQLPANGRMDVVEIFLNAGPMAKSVFALLAFLSIASWGIMIAKFLQYRRAESQGERFLDIFRRSKRFSEVSSAAGRLTATPMVGLFQAGYAEIDAQVKAARENEGEEHGAGKPRFRVKSLDGVERSLRRSITVEQTLLAKGTAFLATTAAASPFIGLFGTVWGIMVAFGTIGETGSTSIVAVAPGIAEALVNTAAGLAAAIPALMGYNYFAYRLRQMRGRMEDFVLEFMNLTERNFT